VAPATVVNSRLLVRQGGSTVDASLQPLPSPEGIVHADPPFNFSAQLSGDGHYLFVVPDGFLEPSTQYTLKLNGLYTSGPARVATGPLGATGGGAVNDTISFRTAPLGASRLPLSTNSKRVSALRLRRLAVPLPPFLPSVNQIGFDSYDLIAGTLATTPPGAGGQGTVLLWVIGGKRGPHGSQVADPKAGFGFPIAGRYRGDSFILARHNLNLTFSFGQVPMSRFELRGQLGRNGRVKPGASLYAEATCTQVPNYGPLLIAIGLCNARDILPASGTFLTDRYGRGGANNKPRGVRVTNVSLTRPTGGSDGEATAEFAVKGAYPAAKHVASIVLTDAATGEPVTIDYVKATKVEAGARGNLSRVRVAIPSGTDLPARVRAYVVTDVFPVAVREFG
jgi:hypothetical protein